MTNIITRLASKVVFTLALALNLPHTAHATGINCKGSSICPSSPTAGTISELISYLHEAIDDGLGNDIYLWQDDCLL